MVDCVLLSIKFSINCQGTFRPSRASLANGHSNSNKPSSINMRGERLSSSEHLGSFLFSSIELEKGVIADQRQLLTISISLFKKNIEIQSNRFEKCFTFDLQNWVLILFYTFSHNMKSWTHVKLAKLFSALYRGVVGNAGIIIILKII